MNMEHKNIQVERLCEQARILPVIKIEDESHILPLADALSAGGLTTLEVTLRSQHGLTAIRRLTQERPELCIGAGTVLNPQQLDECLQAGARFIVSPGITPALLKAASETEALLLPGVSTSSEIMLAMELGYQRFKLFPAEVSGGVTALRALAGPFPSVRFCPTGGINASNLVQYFRQTNVMCVGGSWMMDAEAVRQGNWAHITQVTAQALAAISTLS